MLLTEQEAKALTDKILSFVTADDATASVGSSVQRVPVIGAIVAQRICPNARDLAAGRPYPFLAE